MIELIRVGKKDLTLQYLMSIHYTKPKGFVGRSICYLVFSNGVCYGAIVGGSATLHLPNRNEYFSNAHLNNIVNNVFFHIEPMGGYPCRNFAQKVLKQFEERILEDWFKKYGDEVLGIETLVEPPRTGEVYLRCKYKQIGITKGFTCKRESGKSSDNWGGKRVWNTKDLKPKLVFAKKV